MVPAEVLALIEERQKVESWVAKLGDHEADATPAVFTRVKEDYQSRLADVNTRLAEHHTELQSSLETHSGLVAELQADRDERAESLEEARLRFTVGEYDQPEWDIRREENETTLAELDQKLEDEKATVEELESVISRMTGAGGEDGDSLSAAVAAVTAASAGEALATLEEELDQQLDATPAADSVDEEMAEDVSDADVSEAASGEEELAGDAEEPEEMTSEAPDEEALEDVEEPFEAADEVEEEPTEAEVAPVAESGDRAEGYMDELEFLESLSLDEANKFDAVSAMLDEEETSDGGEEEEQSR